MINPHWITTYSVYKRIPKIVATIPWYIRWHHWCQVWYHLPYLEEQPQLSHSQTGPNSLPRLLLWGLPIIHFKMIFLTTWLCLLILGKEESISQRHMPECSPVSHERLQLWIFHLTWRTLYFWPIASESYKTQQTGHLKDCILLNDRFFFAL